MKHSLLSKIIKVDKLLDQQFPLFIALVLLMLLRVPNFVEPYWYGDEAIYLTIGQSMNKGAILYKEIIDHKTPLIYFLAQTHTQENFRVLLWGWMLVTTIAFYYFAQTLFSNKKWPTFIATILFVLATSLPTFEGNIPNGELFVMGFVLVGMLVLSQTSYATSFLHPKAKKVKDSPAWMYIISGSFLSLGVLTKVPAIFDVAAAAGFGFFESTNALLAAQKNRLLILKKKFVKIVPIWFFLGVGIVLPILLSIAYFVKLDAGSEYLQFGLMYNFRYAGSWGLPFDNPILVFFFSLPGKLVAMSFLTMLLVVTKKYISPAFQFILFWFGLSLFASLLSNRPYPHYYLQIAPALSLLVAGTVYEGIKMLFKRTALQNKNILGPFLATVIFTGFVAILFLLKVQKYPTVAYYTSFIQLAKREISVADYNQRFDSLMSDNYRVVETMKACPDDHLFIWGTNPTLYALADKMPTGRFTVSFHIKDFNAYDETFNDFVEDNPNYVVVMNKEDGAFPQFYQYLRKNYRPSQTQFDNFALWHRIECTVTK